MGKQMQKNMQNEMETVIICRLIGIISFRET